MVREDGDAPANPNKFFFLRPKLDAYLGAKFLSQGRKDLFFKNKKNESQLVGKETCSQTLHDFFVAGIPHGIRVFYVWWMSGN